MRSQLPLELRRTVRSALVTHRYAWAAAGATPRRPLRWPGRGPTAAHPAIKRGMDVLVSAAALLLLTPLLLACALAVKIESPGPAFVPRSNAGKGGRRFRTWRLRTTRQSLDRRDEPAPVTFVGRLLQRSHLEVLPELLSVLWGDMSLVGPRPAAITSEPRPLWHTGRYEAKPGITGLAQIASASLDPDERVRLDIAYVRSWTVALDLRIFARSAAIALETAEAQVRRALRRSAAGALPRLSAASADPHPLSVPTLGARGLVLADIAATGLALATAYGLRFGLALGPGAPAAAPPAAEYAKLFVLMGITITLLASLQQLYRTDTPHTGIEETYAVAKAVTFGTTLALAAVFFYRDFHFSRLALAYFWVTDIVLIGATHAVFRSWLVGRYARGLDLTPTVVVGSPSEHLLDRLRNDPAFGVELIGWLGPEERTDHAAAPEVDAAPARPGVLLRSAEDQKRKSASIAGLPRLGGFEDAAAVIPRHGAARMIIIEHGLTHAQLLETIDACERYETPVQLIPPIYDLLIDPTDLRFINGVPTLRIDEARYQFTRHAAKRLFDLAAATFLLLVLAPLMVAIAIAIRRTSPGPVFFRQTRAGRNGRPFQMLKYRTMVCDAEARLASLIDLDQLDQPVFKIVGDPRITPVGRWLRRFSLDELPQLLNVLRGEMTLVGPRPEELKIVQRYDVWQRRRLKMKPGITGLQQVTARGALADLTERVRLDMYYTRRQSFLLDLVILFRTVGAVLSGRGAT